MCCVPCTCCAAQRNAAAAPPAHLPDAAPPALPIITRDDAKRAAIGRSGYFHRARVDSNAPSHAASVASQSGAESPQAAAAIDQQREAKAAAAAEPPPSRVPSGQQSPLAAPSSQPAPAATIPVLNPEAKFVINTTHELDQRLSSAHSVKSDSEISDATDSLPASARASIDEKAAASIRAAIANANRVIAARAEPPIPNTVPASSDPTSPQP